MSNDAESAVAIVETVEVLTITRDDFDRAPAGLQERARHEPRGFGSASALDRMASASPAMIALAGLTAGFVVARYAARTLAKTDAVPLTRRLSVTRDPNATKRTPADSPKRHGDKFARAMRSFAEPSRGDNRAPTYPEG